MVRHILFLTFTDQIREEKADETIAFMQNAFDDMVGKIPGLRLAEIGKNFAGGPYDIVLYSEFDSPEALAVYQEHPLHLALKYQAKDWIAGRALVDYEV